jgi:hypothetical protein
MNSIRHHGGFLVPDKWRARMNIVFAIGAKYSHLIGADWKGDERDHLVYMTRAVQLLGLKDTVNLISGPDLEVVQAVRDLYPTPKVRHVYKANILPYSLVRCPSTS